MFVKRCFICGARENTEHHCTNANCPRYSAPAADTATATKTTETDTGASK